MGKWVICPRHPSNEFFQQFSNCLTYSNDGMDYGFVTVCIEFRVILIIYVRIVQFAANLFWALNRDPIPLSQSQRELLTWESATERLITASMITKDMYQQSQQISDRYFTWVIEMVLFCLYFSMRN
jgi:digalactosyldiacylglycerol synthase